MSQRLNGERARDGLLMLVDGNSIVNRAYFAFAGTSRLITKNGFPTNAIYGFLNIFFKYYDDLKPTHVCVAFDMKAPTFRHAEYDQYKAGRKGMPDDLAVQLPLLKEIIDELGLRRAECEGFEADDILGTLSGAAEREGVKCVIVTGDRDSLQLASDTTTILLPVTRAGQTRTEKYDVGAVYEKYGVSPTLFIDIKGLMGDSSDNIPGVAGIGEKTAIELVNKHGGIDDIYANLDAVERKSVREKLSANKDMAYLSRRLATIVRDAPCGFEFSDLTVRRPNRGNLYQLFIELQFQSYILKMGLTRADLQDSGPATLPASATESGAATDAANASSSAAVSLATDAEAAESGAATDAEAAETAAAGSDAAIDAETADLPATNNIANNSHATDSAAPSDSKNSHAAINNSGVYKILLKDLEDLANGKGGSKDFVFYPIFEKIDNFNIVLFGAACYFSGRAYYFETEEAGALREHVDLPGNGGKTRVITEPNEGGAHADAFYLSVNEVLAILHPLFMNSVVNVIGHDVKQICRWLLEHGERCPTFDFDTMLGAYIADSADGEYGLPEISIRHLGYVAEDVEAARGKGKSRKTLPMLGVDELCEIAVKCAEAIHALTPILKKIISENDQEELYYNTELPLSEVLASMEAAGFRVDVDGLRQFSAELDRYVEDLTAQIYALAGEEFNINSTRQLGIILYEKLGLTPARKTKTGYSTDADALLDLCGKHPIVEKISEYRMHVKLKSTYTDGLIELINPADGRIHTTMNQAVTATGRISSTEPNLQNIPVRLPLGREIRRLFVPGGDGAVLLGADYSQIELRVLAHISEDAGMIEAFQKGQDIHRSTAAKVFNVTEREVTDEMRTRAKAVNFGIVYGIGDFSLSRDIGVTRKEAREYIDGYLEKFEGVGRYMKETVERGKSTGYAYTLLRRRRSLPELKASNFNVRAFGERVAMNTPVQGSAADIIKIAMVRAYSEFKRLKLKSRLILQVHDELIVEAHADELETAAAVLRDSMEHALTLSIPLTADIYYGDNWKDIKSFKI